MALLPIDSAYSGVQNGFQGLQQNAQAIAKNSENSEKPMIDLMQNKEQVQASVKAIKTGDEMLGSIIDLHA